MGQQRWQDAEKGTPAYQPPYNELKGGEAPFLVEYHDYYMKPRGYHKRSVNSGNAWTMTTPLSFMNMPILTYIKEISPRPVLLIHGEKAHSRYFSETAYANALEPKELMIIPGANHTDLYDKVSVIPLGFDLSRFQTDQVAKRALFRKVYGVADDEIAIGIVGRLVPIKNHDLFLDVLARVSRKTGRKLRAFIVGDGEERERLQGRVSELGMSQVMGPYFNGHGFGHGVNGKPMVERALITFTSWIKEVDIVNAGVDIVMLTSLNEGTPVSLIEAQAANRPIITTRVGGIENVVLPGTTAFLSDSGDTQSLEDQLMRLVENDALRRTMGQGGWAHVSERYHYTRLVNDMDRLYRSLLN